MRDRRERRGRRLGLLSGYTKRQTAVRALALLCVSAGLALTLAAAFHLGVAAISVGLVIGLPGLYLAWAAVRGVEDAPLEPGKLADDLAGLVGRQWEEEAARRRLNDPYPLPVCWVTPDAGLADDWDVLVTLARTGAGWPSASPSDWATAPGELSGCGDQIATVLAKVPTRRLVVLGEPGSGKTMLAVRLVLDLLADRAQGDPVPVLVSLASWNPDTQVLHDWLADRLAVDYPALARSHSGQQSPLVQLLDARLITPVLDGLDEMPEDQRARAIEAINEALRPGESVVVTCRAADYRAAVAPLNGAGVTIRGAGAIILKPLEASIVADYLVRDGGAAASDRWQPIIAELGTGTPVSQVLTTPLMVGLARTIYSPRAGQRADQLPDPGKLCRLPDEEAVKAYLFDAFIPAAYRSRAAATWRAEEAEPWLTFLARHLEATVKSPDLAWWELPLAVRRGILRLELAIAALLCCALVGALAGAVGVPLAFHDISPWVGLLAGLFAGLVEGLAFGIVVGFLTWLLSLAKRARAKPSQLRQFRVRHLGIGIVITGAVCLIELLTHGPGKSSVGGLVLLALALGLALGVLVGLEEGTAPSDLSAAASPGAVLGRDRRAALVLGTGWAVVGGFTFVGLFWFLAIIQGQPNIRGQLIDKDALLGFLVLGFVGALALAFATVRAKTAWPDYVLARSWLAWRHLLPRQLMDFLAVAHQRGVLRQVGSVYQFRHIDMQRRLASRPRIRGRAGRKGGQPAADPGRAATSGPVQLETATPCQERRHELDDTQFNPTKPS